MQIPNLKKQLLQTQEIRYLLLSAHLLWGLIGVAVVISLEISLGVFDGSPWRPIVLYKDAYTLCAPFLGLSLSLTSLTLMTLKGWHKLPPAPEVLSGAIVTSLIYGIWYWLILYKLY